MNDLIKKTGTSYFGVRYWQFDINESKYCVAFDAFIIYHEDEEWFYVIIKGAITNKKTFQGAYKHLMENTVEKYYSDKLADPKPATTEEMIEYQKLK